MAQEPTSGMLVTFYSYKGGTGRSMVLANLGYLLATDPMFSNPRVLLIDWDLEAPGLHRYFFTDFGTSLRSPPHTEEYERKLNESPGVIDYLWRVANRYKAKYPEGGLTEKEALTERAREAFQAAQDGNGLDTYILRLDAPGSLHLLKAGAQLSVGTSGAEPVSDRTGESSYAEKVRSFDWHGFYHSYGSFFTYLRAHLAQNFDFVLIDSRTGLTDTGGICTRVLPDKLVGVFAPNRQNLDGVQDVIRGALNYRQMSRDPRGLLVYPLASRIDGNNSALRQTWWKGGIAGGERVVGYEEAFERLLSDVYGLDECDLESYFNATQIPHDADFAYGERLAVKSAVGTDKLSIGSACGQLARRIVANIAPWEVPEDQDALLEEARRREQAARLEAEEARRRLESNRRALALGLLTFLAPGLWLLGVTWSGLAEHTYLYLPLACWLGYKLGRASLWPFLAACVPIAAVRIYVGDVSTSSDVGILASAIVLHHLFSDPEYRRGCLSAVRLPWRQVAFLFLALLTAAHSAQFGLLAFNVSFRVLFFLVLLLIGLSRIPLQRVLICVLVAAILGTSLRLIEMRWAEGELIRIGYEFWGLHAILSGWLLLLGGRAIREYVQHFHPDRSLWESAWASPTVAGRLPSWVEASRKALPLLLIIGFCDYFLFALHFDSLPKQLNVFLIDTPGMLFLAFALGFFYRTRGVAYSVLAPLILVGLTAVWLGLPADGGGWQTGALEVRELESALAGGIRLAVGERGWLVPLVGCVVLAVYAELGRRVGVWVSGRLEWQHPRIAAA